MRNAYKTLIGKPKRKRPLGDPGADGIIISKCVLWKVWSGCIWLRIGTNGKFL
jgi:hypothetical protein